MQNWMEPVPTTLTARDLPYYEVSKPIYQPTYVSPEDKPAVIADPFQELKNIRREIEYFTSQLLMLKEENQRRKKREIGFGIILSGALAAVLMLYFRSRN